MTDKKLFSIVESPRHPDFSALYKQLGYTETRLGSIRKANAQLKKTLPDVVVAEFIYGYGSNYSGVHISNLDVFLVTLLKYNAQAKVIVIVDKAEFEFVEKLNEIYPLYAVMQHPLMAQQMSDMLAGV